jgi:hypothetical protein
MTRDPKNDVFARLSDRTKFVALGLWSAFFCRTGEACLTGDVSGDRRSDVIAFHHGWTGRMPFSSDYPTGRVRAGNEGA